MYPTLKEIRSLAHGGYSFIPVSIELPSDTLTPVSAVLRLQMTANTRAFLLESADGGEQVGRYSFLGIDPFAKLTSINNSVTYTPLDTDSLSKQAFNFEQKHNENPFDALGRCFAQFKSPRVNGLPPFLGGAVGYLSYDSIAHLEEVPLPGHGPAGIDASLMFFKTVIAFDRLKHRVYLVTHLEPDAGEIDKQYKAAEEVLHQLKHKLFTPAENEGPLDIPLDQFGGIDPVAVSSLIGEERFCDSVKQVKKYIRAGDIFQCVLSDRFTFDMQSDPLTIYRILRMINPSPYLYYLNLGDGENLLGSSPEMLVRATNGVIETCPIAGTRPRGKTDKEDRKFERDLLASVKEKAEHLMLVDLGRNDIGRVSRPGTVNVKEFMTVTRYSHVMHLVSLVEGKLRRGLSAWDALGACFPAGTLSGAPKIRAMEIISELETEKRGVYGGAVICHDFSGNLNSCITIRSLYSHQGKGYIQAGAGLVADSRPVKEYEEVINKAKAMRIAVAIAERVGRSGASDYR